MTELHNHPTHKARQIAETLLATRLGGPVRLNAGTNLPDHAHVFRFALLDAPAIAPNRVIVKCTRSWGQQIQVSNTSEPFPGAQRLFNDWAGIQFLNQVIGDDALVPQFYAGDPTTGLFIMEDLGGEDNLASLLLGDAPQAAEQLLIDIATTLGKLHAGTVGKQDVFNRIRNALGSNVMNVMMDNYDQLALGLYTALERLDLTPRPGLAGELETVIGLLKEPGPFLAYTHGDPCPDNSLRVGSQLRWFDFESGAYRHALIDGVYGRIHFPSCWCANRLPESIWRRMETAYRTALEPSCPEATDDDLYYQAVVVACIYWGLALFKYHPRLRFTELLESDEMWGISSGRQRILARSNIIAQTTGEFGYLETIGATFADLAVQLRQHWPPEADMMPIYPAFQKGIS